MLTPLDDTLRHVLPTTFDHAFSSDPRFFDRYWFAIYNPDGSEPAINTGMCSYLNMNVLDGYASIIDKGVQHNLRVSREYRPYVFNADPNVSEVGPLKVTVVEPFKVIRLECAPNEFGISYDMEWRAVIDAHEEIPNYTRVRGRMNQNYLRYNQVAVVNGWIEIAGERTEMKDWWGGRDHSWGIRTDVAGGEPVTGVDAPRGQVGTLWSWLIFGTIGNNGTCGYVQLQERDDRPTYVEGRLAWPAGAGREQLHADDVRLDFECYPGTRRFSKATWTAIVDDGPDAGEWKIDIVPISHSLAMKGLGYSLGYTDEKGFGVWRGENHIEYDQYDVSHPEDVVMPNGTVDRPYHRDCAVTVTVTSPSGEVTTGAGHCAILPIGPTNRSGVE
jgi:hypothetical protein